MQIKKTSYKNTSSLLFTMSNDNGLSVEISNYGATIVSLKVPDRNGKSENIVLGFDTLKEYEENNSPYFGTIIGRCANRIENSTIVVEGKEYQLSSNENTTHLHGGHQGFDKKCWETVAFSKNEESALLKLHYLSKDKEEGYPGNLSVTISFELNNNNELWWKYTCTTDRTTIVNLTHHDYFNLKDGGKTEVLDHELMINADAYTPMNEAYLPTGEIRPVDNHYADFRTFKNIGEQQKIGNLSFGFNHNYVLPPTQSKIQKAAELYENKSGRLMEVWTTQPGLQLYTSGYLHKNMTGKEGMNYGPYHGVCLEAQHFPNTPHYQHFPSVLLQKEEEYRHQNCLRFRIK